MFKIIFFGPPGAGKGTQANIVADNLNIPHLSTGDILRSKIKQNDDLAVELKKIMGDGGLVSDSILNSIVSERLKSEYEKGFILDGYPRSLDQSIFLNDFLNKKSIKLDFIFNIEIDFEILQKRIIKRSKEENREDDNLEVLKNRYFNYQETTRKVSDYYKKNNSNIFFNINGDHEIDEITDKIKKILKISWIWAKI